MHYFITFLATSCIYFRVQYLKKKKEKYEDESSSSSGLNSHSSYLTSLMVFSTPTLLR